MEVIFRPEWNLETKLWETEDKPRWKVYYLWFRLYVLCMQYECMKQKYLLIPDNYHFDTEKIASLNMFWFTVYPERKKVEYDIRKFDLYTFMIKRLQRSFFKLDIYDHTGYDVYFTMFKHFVKQVLKLEMNEMQHKVHKFWNIVEFINRVCTTGVDFVLNHKEMSLFPRYGTKGYITVANCISCGETAFEKERNNPDMIFCNVECRMSNSILQK